MTQFLWACAKQGPDSVYSAADAVYQNGRIYTVDGNRSWAQAVAIKDGEIVFVGDDDSVAPFVSDATQVHDLKGRMMLPAFQDSHVHPISSGVQALSCDLEGLEDIKQYQEKIQACAESQPDDTWILGGGWLMTAFGPGGAPNKGYIDDVVTHHPVYLISADYHTGWANSRALELAGVTKDTPDPEGGRIDRDPVTGEPIGSLQETAMALIDNHIGPSSPEAQDAGLRYAQDLFLSVGITSVQDAWVLPHNLETYARAQALGELKIRVTASLWWERLKGLEQIEEFKQQREKYTDGLLKATTVKIMQDGVMENYTAALLEPYILAKETKGISMIKPELLNRAVTQLDAEGFQVHFHAVGDGAVRQTLDAIEVAQKTNGNSDNRHHISHLQLISPLDIPRFAELNVTANFQPLWAMSDEYITELAVPFIGEERSRWLYPIKSVQDAGGRIAFGSDWSVDPVNPFPQIETALTRVEAEEHETEVLNAAERIDLASAIEAFTINAAYINKHDDKTGSIEIGKFADLIVVDRNLFDVEPKELSEVKVLL
ncbi:MAG: amidohydrolase, partial [Pseudomonadota bacterium]